MLTALVLSAATTPPHITETFGREPSTAPATTHHWVRSGGVLYDRIDQVEAVLGQEIDDSFPCPETLIEERQFFTRKGATANGLHWLIAQPV